jgi:protein TonB
MVSNYITAAASSTTIILILFYVMQSLIALQPGIDVNTRIRHILTFIHITEPETTNVIDEKTPPVTDYLQPPETHFSDSTNSETAPIGVPNPNPPRPVNPGPAFAIPQSDGPLINVIRVQPTYPTRAMQLGLEGFVIVRFDVGTNGQTENPVVVESSHSVFAKAALRATTRLRYKPRVVDGIAVATSGLHYRFSFEMEK